MKKSKSEEDLNILPKKRKRNLSITKIDHLICEVCSEKVFNYKLCVGTRIYCSEDCLSVLYLKLLNEIQHLSFNDDDMIN